MKFIKYISIGLIALILINVTSNILFGRATLIKEIIPRDYGIVDENYKDKNVAVAYCNCQEQIPKDSVIGTDHFYDYDKIGPLSHNSQINVIELIKENWKFSTVLFIANGDDRNKVQWMNELFTYNFSLLTE